MLSAGSPTLGPQGHLQLAGWREGGSLAGVCIAAVAPVALAGLTGNPFAAFAALFVLLAILATIAMRDQWSGQGGSFDNPLAAFRPEAAPARIYQMDRPSQPSLSRAFAFQAALPTPAFAEAPAARSDAPPPEPAP